MFVKLVRLEYLLHKLTAFLCFSIRMIGVVKNDSGLASCRSVILLKALSINLNAQHVNGMPHFDFDL